MYLRGVFITLYERRSSSSRVRYRSFPGRAPSVLARGTARGDGTAVAVCGKDVAQVPRLPRAAQAPRTRALRPPPRRPPARAHAGGRVPPAPLGWRSGGTGHFSGRIRVAGSGTGGRRI